MNQERYPSPDLKDLAEDVRTRILEVQEKAGFVPAVFLKLARRAEEFRAFFAYHDALMLKENNLSKAEKEMIVVATSGANNCLYCVVAHGAILRIYAKNPRIADQLATNYRKAEITARQHAMLDFAMKVALQSAHIEAADYTALHAAGFTDEDACSFKSHGQPLGHDAQRRVLHDGPDAPQHNGRSVGMSTSSTSASLPRIGFIGIGLMGQGMAANLLAKGYRLSIRVHRNRAAAQPLIDAGAQETSSNVACAQASDILFLCVTGSRQVEEIVLGGEQPGVLSAPPAGLTIIDCSTAEPASTTRLREACEKQGVTFIDAPLARTPKEAKEGRLNIMVGASEADFVRIRPVLATFCENIFHVGGPGAGHTMKLVNNFVSLAQIAALAEGYAVAAKAGLNLKKLFDLMSVGAVNSGLMQGMIGGALEGDLERLKFSIANAQKDLGYYSDFAGQLGLPGPVAHSVHQAFVQASALGLGEAYTPSMLRMQEQINGLSIIAKAGAK
jgi:uncharacterized peroxidase-related enzyme